jgi:DNA modification methylase
MDKITIGNSELYCGDCLELLREIPDGSIDTIICDAPYFQGLTHNGQRGDLTDLNTCKPFFVELFRQFERVCRVERCIYFFTDWRGQAFYYPIFNEILGVKNCLVWDKGAAAGNCYTFCHEMLLFHCERSRNMKGSNVIRSINGFSSGAKKTNGEKLHPSQKPVELIEKLITDSTQQGMTVLDPMMGSGSTGVACTKTGRQFVGMEIQRKYFEIACQRIEQTCAGYKNQFPEMLEMIETKGVE